MNLHHVRPEDRRRSGMDSRIPPAWADTQPGCFRSEGFAEDLAEVEATVSHGTPAATGVQRAWPLLGLALAGVMDVFGR